MSSPRISVPRAARLLLAAACLGVLALAGGCASTPTTPGDAEPDATDTTDPATSAGPSVRPTCAAAPPALLKDTLAADVNAPSEVSDGTSVECTYLAGLGGRTVIIRFTTEQDHAAFADRRRASDADGAPTSDVPGVGDEAYSSSTEFGDVVTNTLVARKGTVEIQVVAAASIDAEKALLGRLFTSLA